MINFIHPEIRINEYFLSNLTYEQFEALTYKTKRKGIVAYDGSGNELGIDDWFPAFVNKHEIVIVNRDLYSARKEFREKFEKKIPV